MLVIVAVFLGNGLYRAVTESLVMTGTEPVFSNYQRLWQDQSFLSGLGMSLWVAFISTIIAMVIGLCFTRAMFRLFKRDEWKLIAWFPMLIPHFVAAYIVFLFFAPSGWFSSLAYQIGWINNMSQFPIFVNDPYYIGVILTYIWKEIPFVVLMLLPIYQEIDFRFEEVSRTLGGNGWSVFKSVELPWIWPISLEIFLILFVFVLGAFEVPALLGVTFPKMVPVLAYDWFYQAAWVNRPLAQASMVSLSVAALVSAFMIMSVSLKWRQKWALRKEEG